ncbi:MAG: AEC family transporter [Candidatus Ratteibacteria bacterium]|nr:AEC family transporter [Candidatus Ratteibacteria bacterium]
MFIKLFIRILAIFGMIAAGTLAKRLNMLTKETASQMSRINTNFFYPALIFTSLVSNFSLKGLAENWVLPLGTLIIMSSGYIIGNIFSRFIAFTDEREKGQFLFQCAINNYSFLPLPIVLMLYGNTGVAQLIFSTLGSELSVWTIGVFAITGNRFRKDSVKNLLSAPMVSIVLSVIVIAIKDSCPYYYSGIIKDIGTSFFSVMDIFGKGTVPIAMFIAGSRMADLNPHDLFTKLQGYVVSLRLLLIPAISAAILYILPFPCEARNILCIVAVMPSAIASVVLSEVYHSDTEFAAASVLTTHLFSLLTIPLWLSFLLR